MARGQITGLVLAMVMLVGMVAAQPPVLADNKYNSQLLDQDYIGTYFSNSPTALFDYFDVDQGNFEILFVSNPENMTDGRNVNQMEIEMFNPIYHDNKAVVLVLKLGSLSDNQTYWEANSTEVRVLLYKKEQLTDQRTCVCDYNVSLSSPSGSMDAESINVRVAINSTGDGICNFSFQGELHYNELKMTAILYCLFVSAITLGQILSAYRIIKGYTNGTVEASKMSLATVAFCNIQDLFLTCMHLYFLMAEDQYYIYFILPIFLLVLLSVVFDMKLLFIVWRTKYVVSSITTADLRKRLTVFYIKFYLGLFTYLTIMYEFTYDLWSLLIQGLLFMPQIVHNVRRGNNPHFYPFYVFGVLGMRMILPLYYRGCPSNIYVIEPSVAFCAIWASLFVMQVTILFLQHKLGPRFFIPRCLIPGYYNYNFKYKTSLQEEVKDCTICLQPLNVPINDSGEVYNLNSSTSIEQPLGESEIMVLKAPCDHMFHKECLNSWIDVKLECPTCRAPLPPFNN